MVTDAANLNYLWAELMVEELIRQGVRYFCIAPGSRCAPLVSAASRHPKATTFFHTDERGLVFHAVGYIAGRGVPAAVIVTSGTALANALPGVVEASKKKLPLILLTADRPPELQKAGAAQTIDQPGIFHSFVRWDFNMPCSTLEVPAAFVLTTIDQAVSRAMGDLPGPVHLNCMFREPLSPERRAFPRAAYLKPLSGWLGSERPFTTSLVPAREFSRLQAEEIAQKIRGLKNGIIAVGKLRNSSAAQAVLSLSERTGFPIFPDVTSGLRLGCVHPNVISHFDQVLLSGKLARRLKVDGIIHVGGRMTSKRFYEFSASRGLREYISVLSHPLRSDPMHAVTLRVQAEPEIFARSMTVLLEVRPATATSSLLRKANLAVDKMLDRELGGKALTEMAIARCLSAMLPPDQGLFLSNSMPLRDMDMYGTARGASVVVGSNRGASGIDGIIASASGFSRGRKRQATLLIGDQAFLHDLNSLAMVARAPVPLVIVLVNNDGGGIFSFLPIAKDHEIFERSYANPHGLSFGSAAELFGMPYLRPRSLPEFVSAYRQALKLQRSVLIECSTRRGSNRQAHERLQRKIRETLSLLSA